MTSLEIQKMKDTQCLVLTKWQFFWHYSIVYVLITISIIITIFTVRGSSHSVIDKYRIPKSTSSFEGFLFLSGSICLALAAIFYYIQTRRLKFKTINISVSADKFKGAAEKTAKELEWKLMKTTNDVVLAKSGFSWKSWCELITIIRENERILINSICDPDRRPSVTSYGMNRKNRETFERFVRDCA